MKEQSLSMDFETRSLIDIKFGAWRYAEDISTSVLCLAYAFPGEKPQLWTPPDPFPEEIVEWVRNGGAIRAFNVEFELAIWHFHIGPLVGYQLKGSQLYCTQAEACAMGLPQSLEECAFALGLAANKQKDPEGKRLIQYLCRPFKGKLREDPERLRALYAYCIQDVIAEQAVAKHLARLPKEELYLFRRTLVMNYRGLPVDMKRVHAMRARVRELKQEKVEECVELTGGISPTQTQALLPWLHEQNCLVPNLQKKVLQRALAGDLLPEEGPGKKVIALRLQAAQSSLAKLENLPRAVCSGNVMRGLFKYHGAATGRYVSQGKFNAQNLPRGELKLPQIQRVLRNVEEANLTELVACLRAVFAFPMSVVDYSQIETRMLLWIAEDADGLREFREGLDPYKTMASRLYFVGYGDVTGEQRRIGKAAVLGAGYQLGANGFIGYCDNSDIPMEHAEATKVIGAFREKYSKVKAAWKIFQVAAVKAISHPGVSYSAKRCVLRVQGGYLQMKLPSGRVLYFRKPWLTAPAEDWMGPQINYMGRDRYTRQWTKCETYGGSLFQSATQASARDVMVDAMARMWKAGLDIRGTVHDEIICKGHYREKMEQIMLVPPDWCWDLPIEVEGWEGEFYRK